jgi:glycosyltransferase involved in cell wall biosynthesis
MYVKKPDSTKKIKVIWMVHWPNPIYTNIANKLGKKVDLTLVFLDYHKETNFSKNNYTAKFLPFIKKPFNIIFFPYYITAWFHKLNLDLPLLFYYTNLDKYLDSQKPDVVISNLWYEPGTVQAAMWCKKNHVSLILQDETQRWPTNNVARFGTKIISKILKNVLFRQSSYILPWTKDGVDFVKKNFTLDAKKVLLLPAGIDTKLFYPISVKKNSTSLNLLLVARMAPFKRHVDALLAMNYLKEKNNINVKLSLLGSGVEKLVLEKKIKELHLENSVHIIDGVPYTEMKKLFCKHDILILPSFNEAIGMVVPEAMACGLPAIISDTCGAKTYIQDGENGFIFKTYDYKDLAEKILLLSDNNLRKKFSENAEKNIKDNFDVDVIAEKLNKIIKQSIKK